MQAEKIREERQRILKHFEKLQKEVEVKEKIEKSNSINQSRLKLLKAREEVMAEALAKAGGKLHTLGDVKDPKYKEMLRKLIVQGLLKLNDEQVVINVRKSDLKLVEDVLSSAVEEFQTKTGRKVKVTIDTTVFLPPSKAEATGAEYCSGGVVLASHQGRIVCDNTLDRRLELAYEGLLPQIRGTLFGYSEARKFYN